MAPTDPLAHVTRLELKPEHQPRQDGGVPGAPEKPRGADKEIFLIGTAHVSKDSVDEVNRAIEVIRPDTVCIELCQTRYAALTDEQRWQKLDVFRVIREGKTLFLLANLAIGAYQRRLGRELGIRPGAEMLAAATKAREIGADVVLVDRDIQVTLKRTWANLSLTRKATLVSAILTSLVTREKVTSEQIEELKQQAHLSELMREFAKQMPDIQGPLIDERDKYMMASVERTDARRIVAVVGAGHVAGMQRYLGASVNLDELRVIPPAPRWTRALKWAIPLLILGALAHGLVANQGRLFAQLAYAWILPTSISAALMTAIAGGKLLSVATAFVGAPITTLHPLIGAGMVVGLVEAWLRKPTVEDAERINQDVESLRGIYRNRFTRVLLVAVGSTIGAALGAWIGATWVISLL